jgi:hypothetical protein
MQVRKKAEGADLPQDRRPFAFIPVLPWRINDGRILNSLLTAEVAVTLQSFHGSVTKLSQTFRHKTSVAWSSQLK